MLDFSHREPGGRRDLASNLMSKAWLPRRAGPFDGLRVTSLFATTDATGFFSRTIFCWRSILTARYVRLYVFLAAGYSARL